MATRQEAEDEEKKKQRATIDWMRQREQELKGQPTYEVRIEGGGPFAPRPPPPPPAPTLPPRRTLDPRRQNAFVQGPDGKLYSAPGWGTTGPHDYGTWARMIGWEQAGRDLNKIRKRARTFMTPNPIGWAREAAEMGKELRDDLARVTEPSPRR